MRPDGELNLDGLRALHREAVELIKELTPLHAPTGGSFAGRDAKGAVTVALDHEGRVADVNLGPDWRKKVGPQGLGQAVVSAVREASTARLTGSGQTPDQRQDDVASGPERAGAGMSSGSWLAPGPDSLPPDPGSAEAAHNIRQMMTVLDAFEKQLTQLNDVLEQQFEGERTATDPGGIVRVSTAAGAVTGVQFDRQWLVSVPDEQLCTALRDALRTAQEQAAAATSTPLEEFPAVDEVRRLAAQPEDLLRRLGLLR